MILRDNTNKLTRVILGKGTIGFNRDKTNTIFVMTEQNYRPVGTQDPSVIGKESTHIGREVIELKFEGKEALKSIGYLIEDLQIIKMKLENEKYLEDIGKQDV